MNEIECNCTKCAVIEKICWLENGKGPKWCPTKNESESLHEALKEYDEPNVKEFARLASVQEGSCYALRDARPFVMIPTKSRLEELIEFSQRMGYKKLGMAFCSGLTHEAFILSEILEKHGFEIVAVSCKVGGIPKERIGVKDEEKIRIGEFESMCNPISQARILNTAKTDFNIMLGLCIGHDSLFLKYIEGLTTVFAVKDRVTGHNPMATLYTSRSYYQRMMKMEFDNFEEMKSRLVSEGKK
ncbi:MAG: DUF1847 domain-containing protein [Thermodesulfobacteriota bacterium]